MARLQIGSIIIIHSRSELNPGAVLTVYRSTCRRTVIVKEKIADDQGDGSAWKYYRVLVID